VISSIKISVDQMESLMDVLLQSMTRWFFEAIFLDILTLSEVTLHGRALISVL
jgi:hypothetical protein